MKQSIILNGKEIVDGEALEYRCSDGKRVVGFARLVVNKEYPVLIDAIGDLCYVSEKNAWRLKKGLVIENEL